MLTLHFHPLSSFCHKTLIALYENDTPFTPQIVNLMDDGERTAFRKLWPIGKFPVLRDDARGETIPETSIIIEYLQLAHPGPVRLIPAEPMAALDVRFLDRFFDLHVMEAMQVAVDSALKRVPMKSVDLSKASIEEFSW